MPLSHANSLTGLVIFLLECSLCWNLQLFPCHQNRALYVVGRRKYPAASLTVFVSELFGGVLLVPTLSLSYAHSCSQTKMYFSADNMDSSSTVRSRFEIVGCLLCKISWHGAKQKCRVGKKCRVGNLPVESITINETLRSIVCMR
jgi:hypothetical protein